MKKTALAGLILAGLFFGGTVRAGSAEKKSEARIRRQFVAFYAQQPSADGAVASFIETIKHDGTWPDINYASKRRGNWDTRDHLDRLLAMAQAYVCPASRYYHQSELQQKIINGLQHWVDQDYKNPNWYNGKIGVPERMLKAFLLLDDDLPPALLKQALATVLNRTKISMTGQNKVWCSGVVLMRGVLQRDSAAVKAASDSIWEELRVTKKEGIQEDASFHQHGPQQQFGNYGLSFGESMVTWGTILRNTPYALSGEKLKVLRNYLLDGPAWVLWNERLDLSGCGRQVDAGCQMGKASGLIKQIQQMMLVDPDFKAEYEARLGQPNRLVGFKSFWRSDMAAYRQPGWMASVKMNSVRTIGCESCNSENVQGLHQADGTLLVYQSGREYEDIQPLWDWKRLPGTTCDQGLKKLGPKNKARGGTAFAGSLGDGESGVAAMIYKRGGFSAHKAWFFGKESIVCLGAGIDGETSGAVYTSVQQALLSGPVTTSTGPLSAGKTILPAGSWVHHAGMGYQLLNDTVCQTGSVEGNWLTCFPTRGDRPAEGEAFSLWMDHGASPNAQSYAYTVYPQTRKEALPGLIENGSTRVLSNTEKVQAVENADGVSAVFYEAGKLTSRSGIVIEVDAPCLLKRQAGNLTVADPAHKVSMVTVTLNGTPTVVPLPAGNRLGQPVRVSID